MKRDLDLIRALLFRFEELPLNGHVHAGKIAIDGRSRDEIVYHCFLLFEAGMIRAADASSYDGRNIIVLSITPSGHDYIDAIRADSVWKKVTGGLAKVGGGAALEIVKALALSYVSRELGL